jgi:mono/diheme cytochrome c family protein
MMMSKGYWTPLLIAMGLSGVAAQSGSAPPSGRAAPNGTTIWDGVYSAEQAQRGQKAYEKSCGYCHRDNLEGDEGPPLVGSPFTLRWRNQTLEDMFKMIQETMPQDAPATLSPETYADIVSYLLKANGAPPGREALAVEIERLARIRFTQKPK